MKMEYPRFPRAGMVLTAACVLMVTVFWQGLSYGGPEEKKFLADRHQAKGIACASCHKESPPKAAVPMAVCLGCHGSYEKIASRTINASPNPHASHMGELACENCHHAHKASVSQCNTCHEFNMKMR